MDKVSKHVTVKANLSRSINLTRDKSASEILDSYILTSCAMRSINSVAAVCKGSADINKAWALIGTYGSGKSSFALFLSHLLSCPKHSDTKTALEKLVSHDSASAAAIKKYLRGSAGYCKVLLTGYPESLTRSFLQTLRDSATEYCNDLNINLAGENKIIKNLLRQKSINLSTVREVVEKIQLKIQRANGKGLLIIIDELGKFLEYAARHESDDVFLLQVLAEQTYKSDKGNLLLFVLLHQSFEQYGKNLNTKLKNEWTKIQGRYEALPFVETTEQSLYVMAEVFSSTLSKTKRLEIRKKIRPIVSVLEKTKALPSGLDARTAVDLFEKCYPLHPVSLLLLPVLCQKIAQNERTLFNYLGSAEPYGLMNQMKSVSAGDFVYPHNIYDYFIDGQPLVNNFQTQRTWVEIITAMDRLANEDHKEICLLKTIGLLNMAGGTGGFKASNEVLGVCSDNSKVFNQAIKNLKNKSIVTYRKFNHEYRVWQGSDFNLEQALSEQQVYIQTIDVAHELNNAEVFIPFVAKRYSIEKHSLFYFQPVFINVPEYKKEAKSVEKPRIIFCLSYAAEKIDKKIFKEKITQYFSKHDVCVFCSSSEEIKQASKHRIALEKVGQNPIIDQDPVIQREFKLHLIATQQQEKEKIKELVERPRQHLWYYDGKKQNIKTKRDIQSLLSNILESVYPNTPIIRNELINRDNPSAQASAGRKNLLVALLQNQDQENLGIEGYPPEKSMYLAILKNNGIHQLVKGKWQIVKPSVNRDNDYNFMAVWKTITKFLSSTQQSAQDISQLDSVLSNPPYGVKKAVLPIFYMSVYLCQQDEIAVYEDRSYVPYFTIEHLERFLKRPQTFSFQQFKIEGVTQTLIKEYEKGLFEGGKSKNILSLFKPMAMFIKGIPEYTKQTNNLSKTAQKIRGAFKHPKSPQDLLFEKLPKACGYGNKPLKGFGEALKKALYEIKNAYPDMLSQQENALKKVFNLKQEDDLEKLRIRATETCEQLKEYTLDKNLRIFLDGVTTNFGDDHNWLERLLSLIVNKASKSWNDDDALYARHKIMENGKKMAELDKLRIYSQENMLNKEPGSAVMFSLKDGKGRNFDEVIYLNNSFTNEEKKKFIERSIVDLVTSYIMEDKPKSSHTIKKMRLIK